MIQFDFLVVGSGIAGLSYALKVADYGKVCVMCKTQIAETATSYAQGGIAAVTSSPDTEKKHFSDTIICGDGLCNEDVVKMVVKEGKKRIQDLINWGADFDKNEKGHFDLAKEGGHSEYRVIHHKDNSGFEIQRALTEQVKKHPNITVCEHHFAIEIITQHHLGKLVTQSSTDIQCFGVYAYDIKKKITKTYLSKVTVLATGGSGNLYLTTTNPVTATGDGVAMVYRAKGAIENMEFVQFHPTSLYNPKERPSFLITEALRGAGAILKDIRGNDFMLKYDKRGSLASRDIVARAIDNEMKIHGDDYVYLDATHIDKTELNNHFPNIMAKCKNIGIDITKDMIPVVPAAHYQCGGIKVDMNGQSNILRLYAIGEVSSTGLHGANRLASNSLLEAVVYAHRAAMHSKVVITKYSFQLDVPEWNIEGTTHPEEMVLISQNYKEVQQIMTNYVGIVRSNLRLTRALSRLEIIYKETEELFKKSTLSRNLCELRNIINNGYLTIKMAQERKESVGLHYNIDYLKKKTQ